MITPRKSENRKNTHKSKQNVSSATLATVRLDEFADDVADELYFTSLYEASMSDKLFINGGNLGFKPLWN